MDSFSVRQGLNVAPRFPQNTVSKPEVIHNSINSTFAVAVGKKNSYALPLAVVCEVENLI